MRKNKNYGGSHEHVGQKEGQEKVASGLDWSKVCLHKNDQEVLPPCGWTT